MSPTWAQVVANDMKSPRTQSKVTRNPEPTDLPEQSVWGPTTRDIEATRPNQQSQQEEADSIGTDQKELENETSIDELVLMESIQEANPSPRVEAQTVQNSVEPSQDTPLPQTDPQTLQPRPNTHERITIETQGQLRAGIHHEIQTETREQIVDDYFRSPIVQEAMSNIICADAFCKAQILVKGLKGRWATCQECSQKTCVMSSCSLLERSHLNSGWQICPDGAAAMGLEKIARARKWARCEICHRFLLKVEGDSRGRSLPCEDCAGREGRGT